MDIANLSSADHPARSVALQEWLTDPSAPSWQSRFINALLQRLPIKKRTASAAAIQARVRQLALRPASHAPSGLGRDIDVRLETRHGWPVYFTAAATGPQADHRVVFLHGGGYVNEIVRAHWRLIGFLNRTARVRCVVPIFPLAPAATAAQVVPMMGALLRELIDDAGTGKVTVVGNSAGAGLALATAQWLRDAGQRQPDGLILISPGINASVGGAERVAIAARDPINDIPGVLEGARLYAGGLGVAHPYVSPLAGDMHGLAPMLVFSGTRDLLYPDSIELAAKARAAGVAVDLHLRRDQPHNYAGLPTPEARDARNAIVRQLVQRSG